MGYLSNVRPFKKGKGMFCASYTALQSYKYCVKLVPGTVKNGKVGIRFKSSKTKAQERRNSNASDERLENGKEEAKAKHEAVSQPEEKVSNIKQDAWKLSRGQRVKLKLMKEKYADQDEEEHCIRISLLVPAGKPQKNDKAADTAKASTSNEEKPITGKGEYSTRKSIYMYIGSWCKTYNSSMGRYSSNTRSKTFGSAIFAVKSPYFVAKNITFKALSELHDQILARDSALCPFDIVVRSCVLNLSHADARISSNPINNLRPERLMFQWPNLETVHASGCQNELLDTMHQMLSDLSVSLDKDGAVERTCYGKGCIDMATTEADTSSEFSEV